MKKKQNTTALTSESITKDERNILEAEVKIK
jgi:hypothetical protein